MVVLCTEGDSWERLPRFYRRQHITEKNLEIKNDRLAQTMMEEIDVVVNVAADTNFK